MLDAKLAAAPQRTAIIAEERARADVYGLIANLFANAPTERLLRAVAESRPQDADAGAFAAAWCGLCESAAHADPRAVADEFDDLFIGIGPGRVNLYAAHYLQRGQFKNSLAALRGDLARLGLAARDDAGEPEDHLSALCEAMRYLIAGDDAAPAADLEAQHEFFARHVQPWYRLFCSNLRNTEGARFYVGAADFAEAFFDLETQSFELED